MVWPWGGVPVWAQALETKPRLKRFLWMVESVLRARKLDFDPNSLRLGTFEVRKGGPWGSARFIVLDPAAIECAATDAERWLAIVTRHITGRDPPDPRDPPMAPPPRRAPVSDHTLVIDGRTIALDGNDFDAIAPFVRLQLVSTYSPMGLMGRQNAITQDVAEDLSTMLTLNLGPSEQNVPPHYPERWGVSVEAAMDVGRRNARTLAAAGSEPVAYEVDDPSGVDTIDEHRVSTIEGLAGTSYFIAATSVSLIAAIEKDTLVTVPTRKSAFFHVLEAPPSRAVIASMAELAAEMYGSLDDALSPHVYLFREGAAVGPLSAAVGTWTAAPPWRRVTRPTASGGADLPSDDDLGKLVSRTC